MSIIKRREHVTTMWFLDKCFSTLQLGFSSSNLSFPLYWMHPCASLDQNQKHFSIMQRSFVLARVHFPPCPSQPHGSRTKLVALPPLLQEVVGSFTRSFTPLECIKQQMRVRANISGNNANKPKYHLNISASISFDSTQVLTHSFLHFAVNRWKNSYTHRL